MTRIPPVNEETIRELAAPESYARGEDYYDRGAVQSLVQRGSRLDAEVQGSGYEPYRVSVTLREERIEGYTCSCPYDWGGACKHVVAALLAAIHSPGEIEERQPVEMLLANLDRDQLMNILIRLAADDLAIADEIETLAPILQQQPPADTSSPAETARPQLDPAPYHKRVRSIFRAVDFERSYYEVDSVIGQVGELVEQAEQYIAAGDARNALVILEAVTDEYIENVFEMDDSDGDLGDYLNQIGQVCTEAVLSVDLTPKERKEWAKRTKKWLDEASDYGDFDGLEMAHTAVAQGWDYKPLQRVLQGKITDQGAWDGEAPEYADSLALIRLKILERQGNTQEYLNLAEAEGRSQEYVVKLARLGRIPEAVSYALEYLTVPDEILALAGTLKELGAAQQALRVAEQGLSLDGRKAELAAWTREEAHAAGKTDLALRAARIAFASSLKLDAYKAIQSLSGEKWPALREELLNELRSQETFYGGEAIDIFLYEDLIDDAITQVENRSSRDLIKVADAATATRPDWVITVCKRQAEAIMDAAKSKYYTEAIYWLERVRSASEAAGKAGEFQTYLQSLISKHSRKYSLAPMLERLRGKR